MNYLWANLDCYISYLKDIIEPPCNFINLFTLSQNVGKCCLRIYPSLANGYQQAMFEAKIRCQKERLYHQKSVWLHDIFLSKVQIINYYQTKLQHIFSSWSWCAMCLQLTRPVSNIFKRVTVTKSVRSNFGYASMYLV